MITAQLVEVGRNKVTKEVTLKDMESVYNEVRRHLMSNEVEMIAEDEEECEWSVIVGGFRPVGKVHIKCGCGEKATKAVDGVYKCDTCSRLT